EHLQGGLAGKEKYYTNGVKARDLKDAAKPSPAQDAYRTKSEKNSTRQPARFLIQLDAACSLFLQRTRQGSDLRESPRNLRCLLNGSECRSKTAGEDERCDQRRMSIRRLEEIGNARSFQGSAFFLLLPGGRFRQERANYDQRQRGHNARDEHVTPGIVRSPDRWQGFDMCDDQFVCACDHQPANRREGLGVSEDALAPLRGLQKLREPGHGGDKLDADPDKSGGAQDQKHQWRRAESSRKGRKGIQENAPDQNTAAQIGRAHV